MGSPGGIIGKESTCQCRQRPERCGFNPWVRKIPWRRKCQPMPVFLPGEFHGQRSLASYSPWGHKESDTAEWLSTLYLSQSQSHSLFCPCFLHPWLYFCFVGKFTCTIFLDSKYKLYHMIFVFLCLTFHSVWSSLGPSLLLQMVLFCSFL